MPDRDDEIVRQLNDAGAIVIGKTGLHEFAYGVTSNNPHFGAVRHPWDTESIPGGSSGGSAAAVAAHLSPFATGTDTGGSIRIPASVCGRVGLHPPYGRVSRRGRGGLRRGGRRVAEGRRKGCSLWGRGILRAL